MSSIICLIIASHSDYYDCFIQLWREKINIWNLSKTDIGIRFFFVFADPSLSDTVICESDCIYCKCEENLEPGIFLKTMMAIQFFEEKKMEYSYIMRTNLSSFWNFSVFYSDLLLLPISIGTIFFQYLDRKNLIINDRWREYFDIIDSFFSISDIFIFLDGAGFLLSRDMIRLLLIPIPEDKYYKLLSIPDDIAITLLLFYNIIHHCPVKVEINEMLIGKKYICDNEILSPNERNIDVGFIRNKHIFDRNIDVLNFERQISFFYK